MMGNPNRMKLLMEVGWSNPSNQASLCMVLVKKLFFYALKIYLYFVLIIQFSKNSFLYFKKIKVLII